MKIQVRDANNEELAQAIQAIGAKDALIDRLIAERDRLDAENEQLNIRIASADRIIAGQGAEIDEQEKAMRAMRIEVAQTRRQLERVTETANRVVKIARGEE